MILQAHKLEQDDNILSFHGITDLSSVLGLRTLSLRLADLSSFPEGWGGLTHFQH